jgi:6-phosphogluconolactonase (cycloisomerase 2 family)
VRRVLAAVVAGMLCALAAAPGSGAALIEQLPRGTGCFVPGPRYGDRWCARGTAIFGPDSVVVAPDGRGVYVVTRDPDHLLGIGSSSLVAYDRNPRTGALRQRACFSDDAGDGREGTDGTCIDADALQSANDIAISPDGRSLYVSSDLGAIAIFARDPANGAVRQAGCVKDWAPDSRCADAQGMARPVSVTVSPDGRFIHVTSRQSNSIVTFARDSVSGLLRQSSCVSDTGLDGLCMDVAALVSPTALAVSPDGRSAYVTTAKEQNSLVAFSRDPATGTLAPAGCFMSGPTRVPACRLTPGLLDASAVTVSPDGRNVYVTAIDSNSIVTFRRDTRTGTIDPFDCIAGPDGDDPRHCRKGDKLSYAADVAVTPDGRGLVLVAAGDDAVAVYSRDRSTGRLQRRACLEWQREDRVCRPAHGIFGPKGLALSPRADHVYVTADTGNAVAAFRLDPAP